MRALWSWGHSAELLAGAFWASYALGCSECKCIARKSSPREGRMWPGGEGLVFWQKPLYNTTVCAKTHNLRSPSPLRAFREERKCLGQRFASHLRGRRRRWRGGGRKSFRHRSRLAVFYLVPRTRCLSRRQPRQTSLTAGERPRVPQPEPRGNLRAAPRRAGLGWAGPAIWLLQALLWARWCPSAETWDFFSSWLKVL